MKGGTKEKITGKRKKGSRLVLHKQIKFEMTIISIIMCRWTNIIFFFLFDKQ
jgi:hypothetical protein